VGFSTRQNESAFCFHEILFFMRLRAGEVRKSEWVVLSFLVYAIVLAALLPLAAGVRIRVIVLNTAVILSYAFLVLLDQKKERLAWSVPRDWIPLALIILAYREMGWFAQPHLNQDLETSWVIWDRAVLRGGGKAAIEILGPLLPSVLEISYALVYALAPFAVAMLYVYQHRERVDRFLFVFAVGVLLCYGQFPFWPSEPPRVVFLNDDLPYNIVFRRFNLWMLGNYGIHTSVFPSAHVGGSFATAMGAWRTLPEHKWVGRFLLVMAILIAIATVYGRYHYLVDALAGIAMAILAFVITSPGPTRSGSRPQ
jgi:membrane-associated phospholipid phosphatase